jgi:GH15 family glucan-1,4-alpha-glucosidase
VDWRGALQATEAFWRDWSAKSTYGGRWRQPVQRSLLTLKALTYATTGGIIAAPTTSLPEQLGGQRNWDYRYCWLRDATFTLLALMSAGYFEEAQAWRAWVQRSVAGSPDQIQIMYGLAGERHLPEWQVPWLSGYHGAAPVRVGNAAADQLQLDVFGELVDTIYQSRKHFLAPVASAWAQQMTLIQHLEDIWELPDQGIWEMRGERRQFTFSKVRRGSLWIAPCAMPSASDLRRLWSVGASFAIVCMRRSANAGSTRVGRLSHKASAAASSMPACCCCLS